MQDDIRKMKESRSFAANLGVEHERDIKQRSKIEIGIWNRNEYVFREELRDVGEMTKEVPIHDDQPVIITKRVRKEYRLDV